MTEVEHRPGPAGEEPFVDGGLLVAAWVIALFAAGALIVVWAVVPSWSLWRLLEVAGVFIGVLAGALAVVLGMATLTWLVERE